MSIFKNINKFNKDTKLKKANKKLCISIKFISALKYAHFIVASEKSLHCIIFWYIILLDYIVSVLYFNHPYSTSVLMSV